MTKKHEQKKKRQTGLLQNEKFCLCQRALLKMKRQSTEEEEILANYISDEDLLLRIYK